MLVVGAGGFAKQLIQSLELDNQASDCIFFDNLSTKQEFLNQFRVISSDKEVQDKFKSNHGYLLGIGDPKLRLRFSEKMDKLGGKLSSHVSSNCVISPFNVEIEVGVTILPKVYIEPEVTIGRGTLINVNAFIAHDVSVGEFCEISPGAQLLGRSSIGKRTFIGSNAVVLPNISIGDDCIIGAGAVVTKNVKSGSTIIGVPGKQFLS